MHISNRSDIASRFLSFYIQNQNSFKSFERIYIFGSVLSNNSFPNDIDILHVYSSFKNEILVDINKITEQTNHLFDIPLDITVLSIAELNQTAFLSRIKHYYRIK